MQPYSIFQRKQKERCNAATAQKLLCYLTHTWSRAVSSPGIYHKASEEQHRVTILKLQWKEAIISTLQDYDRSQLSAIQNSYFPPQHVHVSESACLGLIRAFLFFLSKYFCLLTVIKNRTERKSAIFFLFLLVSLLIYLLIQ